MRHSAEPMQPRRRTEPSPSAGRTVPSRALAVFNSGRQPCRADSVAPSPTAAEPYRGRSMPSRALAAGRADAVPSRAQQQPPALYPTAGSVCCSYRTLVRSHTCSIEHPFDSHICSIFDCTLGYPNKLGYPMLLDWQPYSAPALNQQAGRFQLKIVSRRLCENATTFRATTAAIIQASKLGHPMLTVAIRLLCTSFKSTSWAFSIVGSTCWFGLLHTNT